MTVMALLGVLVMAAGVAGLVLLEVLIKRPDVAAVMVFAAVVVQALYEDKVPAVTLGGTTNVYVTDLLAASIMAAALARVLRLKRFDPFHRWLLLLGVLLGVSLLLGIAAFGIQTAVSDFRQYLFFIGVALYFSTFAPSQRLSARIGRIWLIMTVPMMLLAVLRWVQNFADLRLGVPASTWGADAAVRVLDGPYVFFLAQAFMLTIPAWLSGQQMRRQRLLSVVLLLMVIALDRRTAWLAVIAGIAVLLLRDRRLGRPAMGLAALGGALAVVGFAYLGGLGEGPAHPVVQQGTGNFAWRVEGWSDLLGSWLANPVSWVIGEPFGSSFARVIAGTEVTSNPHNFYIATMLRSGVPGLLALLVLTVGVILALWRAPAPATGLLDAGMMPALLVMQLVWYLTWIPGSEQGIVTGLAIGMAAMHRTGYRPDSTPAPQGRGPRTVTVEGSSRS